MNCLRKDCLHNSYSECKRDEILIDKIKIDNKEIWICKCYSDIKISGHMDFFRLLKPNGTAIGGSLSDREAEKMYQDSLKFKSYVKGHKDSKEPKRRKTK